MFYETMAKLRKIMKVCAAQVMVAMICGASLAHGGYAQVLDRKVTIDIQELSLEQALYKIQEVSGVKFYFSLETLGTDEEAIVSIHVINEPLRNILNRLLHPRDIRYRVDEEHNSIIILKKDTQQSYTERTANAASASLSMVIQHSGPITVTGTVTDATTRQTLAGVSILVRGTTHGTTSDSEGRYTVTADGDDVLAFSFIGFVSQEVIIGFRTVVDVVLQPDVQNLKAVEINAGYYNVTERESTGSISKVSAEVIERQPITNPLGALQGRMPGVYIQQTTGIPGGDFKIQIRGRNSLRNDGNEPFYVVDGVPYSTEKVSAEAAAQAIRGAVSPLTSLNPADIESIEVLKDADATAIYGSRGSNGVVLITTKNGRAGRTRFDLNLFTGAGKTPLLKMLNTNQYLAMRREAFANDGISEYPANAYDVNGIWDTTRYTDWQKVLIGNTAKTFSIQSSLSGGSELTQFLFSTGYKKETSVFPGDFGYHKGSAHLSLNHYSANRRLIFNLSVSSTLDKNTQVNFDYTARARVMPPNAPALYDQGGNLNWENNTWTNPLAALERNYEADVSNVIGNITVAYEVSPALKLRSSFGLNSLVSKELNIVPSTTFPPVEARTSESSYVITGNGGSRSWIVEPQLSWDKKMSRGHLQALIGSTFQQQDYRNESFHYQNFPSNALLGNLSLASLVFPYTFTKSLYRYVAIFGRVNYNWTGKYIFNLTARRDGSSRFGSGRQFVNFGAIGAAWIFSNESFLENALACLSFGKLRGSYGTTGSDQIGNYQFLDTYTNSNTEYQGITGLYPERLYNPDFAWETNRKVEGAIELGFFHDRLLFELNYYLNRSSNQLVNYTLPTTTGFNGILANLGATVQNTGWEADLTTVNLSHKLRWLTSFNITIPKNKLIEFPNIEASSYANTYVVGESIYIKMFYESTGVDPETGLYTFRDYNNDGILTSDDDQKKVHFVGQRFYGGLSNTFEYKGWALDVFFQFVGQNGYNFQYQAGAYGFFVNMPAVALKYTRWRKPGDIADMQRYATEMNDAAIKSAAIYGQQSDAVLGTASFIRLKNISLSYVFPRKLTKSVSCKLYARGQNLFVITEYEGYDPETQFTRISPLRLVTAGISLTL